MALPPVTDDAFIREVDEEVRRDQLSQLWRRYGRWTLIAVGLFLVALVMAARVIDGAPTRVLGQMVPGEQHV